MKSPRLAIAVLAAAALFTSAARAEPQQRITGVVELFTSQGCNSCPPADAVLEELGRQPDIIALGYHVDYWDYLGWRDTMATPDNTARQNDYRGAFGKRAVYTPQAVVNGKTHMNGAKRGKINAALSEYRQTGFPVSVDVIRRGESIVIRTGAMPNPPGGAHLLLVFFDEPKSIDIAGGENGGRKVGYWNPVTAVQTAGMWNGEASEYVLPASMIAKKGGGGCAVLLQSMKKEGGPSAILGAALIGRPLTN